MTFSRIERKNEKKKQFFFYLRMHSNKFPVTGSGVSKMMHSSSGAQVSLSQMAKKTYEMNVSNNFEGLWCCRQSDEGKEKHILHVRMHSNRLPVTGSGESKMMHSSSLAQVSFLQMTEKI